jgi:hypothetical protein
MIETAWTNLTPRWQMQIPHSGDSVNVSGPGAGVRAAPAEIDAGADGDRPAGAETDDESGAEEVRMNADWEPGGLLLETWIDLACAVKAYSPGDEEIVARHVREAYERLDAARLKAIEEECEHV